jgi:DNA-binding FrmR family transcriptional regulator
MPSGPKGGSGFTMFDKDTPQCCETTDRKSNHPEKTKQELICRLNRIEGQVRGVKAMIERDVYCDDILNQIASIQAALNSTGKMLLDNHMKSCVKVRILSGDEDIFDELLKTIHRMLR